MRVLPPVSSPDGAYHASELGYLFDEQTPRDPPPLNGAQQALADDMVQLAAASGG